MNSISRNSTKPQDYSTGFTRKGYTRNPMSHAFISFDPFIICMLTFKGDFWINRFSPKDRQFIPTVYLRSFCQIAGVIYPNLCWSSNLENINNNHYHLHLILFPDGLNPYRVNSYVETLENLWMRVFPNAIAVIPVPAAIATPSFSIAAAAALTESLQIQISDTRVRSRIFTAIARY